MESVSLSQRGKAELWWQGREQGDTEGPAVGQGGRPRSRREHEPSPGQVRAWGRDRAAWAAPTWPLPSWSRLSLRADPLTPRPRQRGASSGSHARPPPSLPELHTVHPSVRLRPADLDGQPVHLRLRLLQRRPRRQVLPAVCPAEGAGAGGEAPGAPAVPSGGGGGGGAAGREGAARWRGAGFAPSSRTPSD